MSPVLHRRGAQSLFAPSFCGAILAWRIAIFFFLFRCVYPAAYHSFAGIGGSEINVVNRKGAKQFVSSCRALFQMLAIK